MPETAQAKTLQITLRRSGIGCTQRQRQTLLGLGLFRIGKTVLRKDSPSLQGMLRKVSHLIEVSEHGSK
jgi:large subunit ribosomal protein L30